MVNNKRSSSRTRRESRARMVCDTNASDPFIVTNGENPQATSAHQRSNSNTNSSCNPGPTCPSPGPSSSTPACFRLDSWRLYSTLIHSSSECCQVLGCRIQLLSGHVWWRRCPVGLLPIDEDVLIAFKVNGIDACFVLFHGVHEMIEELEVRTLEIRMLMIERRRKEDPLEITISCIIGLSVPQLLEPLNSVLLDTQVKIVPFKISQDILIQQGE